MFKKVVHGLVGLSCALMLGVGVAHADNKLVVKLGWATSDGATDPYAVGARAFKKALEEKSNGSIEVQLFPNRQLGDEKQLMEGLRFGTVDMAVVTNAVVAQTEPAFQVLDLPFVFADESQAHKAVDGPVGVELAKRLSTKGVVVLGYLDSGFRNMINNRRPVVTPADMRGVKVRVMQNPLYIDIINSLGGSAVPMAWSETFTAIQQGTIDGLEVPVTTIEPLKINEVTKFLSLTNHTYSALGLLAGKRLMDRLTPAQRDAFTAAAATAIADQRRSTSSETQKALASLERAGMKVNKVQDPAAFRTAVAPVYEKVRQSGHGALLDQLIAGTK